MFLYVNPYYDFDLEWACEDEPYEMFADEDSAKPFWEEISEKAIAEGKRIGLEDKVLLEVFDKEEDCWKEVCGLK